MKLPVSRGFIMAFLGAVTMCFAQRSRAESVSSPKVPKVTVVVFLDYQGPFDARAMPTLTQIEKERETDARFVFRNFPLPMHKDAQLAACAAIAADEQGKLREMQGKLFGNEAALKRADLIGYARAIGLDVSRFTSDLDSPSTTARVNADMAAGRQAGVSGTPTILVGDRKLVGVNHDSLNAAIEEAPGRTKAFAEDAKGAAADKRPLDPAVARDIARATAAHISTTVMGVPLGEKLQLPKCSAVGSRNSLVKDDSWRSPKTCLPDGERNKMVWGKESLPPWVMLGLASATVEDRVLLGASFFVIETDDLAKDLEKKYGVPKHSDPKKFQNRYGATTTSHELDWDLPGLTVHYEPRTASADGSEIRGFLEINLETLQKRQKAQREEVDDTRAHL